MQILSRIKIVSKLGIVLITNLILVVTMGVAAYWSSQYLHDELLSVFSTEYAGISVLLEADRDLHQALIAERSMCFITPDSDQFKGQMKDYTDNIGQADTRIKKFLNVFNTPETRKYVDAYFADRKKWDPVTKQVITYVEEGKNAAAQALSLGEAKELFDAMRENLNKLTEIVETQSQLKQTRSNESFQKLIYVLLGITFFSLIFGSLITVVISRNITVPIHKMVAFAQQIKAGDLNATLAVKQKDENGVLAQAFQDMLVQLNRTLAEVKDQSAVVEEKAKQTAEALELAKEATGKAESAKAEGLYQAAEQLDGIVGKLSDAAERISLQADEISQGTAVQSERITGAATAMEEMNASVFEVAKNSGEAASASETAMSQAQDGAKVVENSIEAINATQRQSEELKLNMDELSNQAQSIGQILGVITDIADQTNLLALNAAIEAARAGEAGRGFAVVADEVRKLAEKTMNATKEVGEAISSIQSVADINVKSMERATVDLSRAVELSGQSRTVLSEIVVMVSNSSERVQGIATATEEQSSASEEITRSVDEVSQISQQTAEGILETTNALQSLAAEVEELSALVRSLKEEGSRR
ncbi:methyl-accepting chemotaxis protein [Desulfovibrio sp. UCD-KL4C]|uniref:methyl-accepting chemotaxis protein n=1 Tax=Desulfovibrio sp. UCD-KL4C TaxID=2578120 RepID=UPI0025B98841|nr:methyl-accepting chemotaxis protein [Desulfovibrio sp. UCD-KL4C]